MTDTKPILVNTLRRCYTGQLATTIFRTTLMRKKSNTAERVIETKSRSIFIKIHSYSLHNFIITHSNFTLETYVWCIGCHFVSILKHSSSVVCIELLLCSTFSTAICTQFYKINEIKFLFLISLNMCMSLDYFPLTVY
jgi:hypothetical protein